MKKTDTRYPTPDTGILYAFTLGREWKLSLAELFAIFGGDSYRRHSEEVALFEVDEDESSIIAKFRNIGGSIRAMRVIGETDEARFATDVINDIMNRKSGIERSLRHSKELTSQPTHQPTNSPAKITFALGAYGLEYRLSDIGLRIKKTLQEKGRSARLVNTENKNINAATFKKERLGRSQSEYNIIQIPVIARNEVHQKTPLPPFSGGLTPNELTSQPAHQPTSSPANPSTQYLTRTLTCQDIDAYARRDTGKSRDMIVGMMPPKLVQMMLNLATSPQPSPQGEGASTPSPSLKEKGSGDEVIYDPFCGLGTTLIEAANMGYTDLLGSDISKEMVDATTKSLASFIDEEKMWQERIKKVGGTPTKDFTHFQSSVFELDARDIEKALPYLKTKNGSLKTISIVSEGYLGEMMQKESITTDRVKTERAKLARMYDDFFGGLARIVSSNSLANASTSQPTSQPTNPLTPELTIVISFPFWDVRGTQSYFTEIYEILEKHRFCVTPLLPSELNLLTPKGTLLYKRPGQNVGREITKIIYNK